MIPVNELVWAIGIILVAIGCILHDSDGMIND